MLFVQTIKKKKLCINCFDNAHLNSKR